MNRERDDNIYYARLAEQGERYEDMIRYMKEVAKVSDWASFWIQSWFEGSYRDCMHREFEMSQAQ